MPIYEYECPKCGLFECVQKATDKPLKANPDCCDKNCPKKAQKVISAAAFHLKGGGWYKTDYGSTGSAGKGKAKSDTATTESSDSVTKKDDSTKKETKGKCGSGCGCH